MTTVVVSGGRQFSNTLFVYDQMNRLHAEHRFTKVVAGKARGVDTIAEKWARAFSIPFAGYRANWKKHDNAAGPIRNQEMLDAEKPDLVIAFPGGRGTRDMRLRARRQGYTVIDLTDVYEELCKKHLAGWECPNQVPRRGL